MWKMVQKYNHGLSFLCKDEEEDLTNVHQKCNPRSSVAKHIVWKSHKKVSLYVQFTYNLIKLHLT